tara:strand:- start:988 stop:1248 length:261 start_codon:yes stop_codon:yes gene_type:complete
MKLIDYTGPENLEALEAAAIEASADCYVVITTMGFSGYALCCSSRLPGDARSKAANNPPSLRCYFHKGNRRDWTTAQIVADQKDWR